MLEPHFATAKTARCCHPLSVFYHIKLIYYPLQKFFGAPFGLTSKVPKSAFSYRTSSSAPVVHEADNGSGTLLHREFCGRCGSGILEYGANAGDFVYVMHGTLDRPGELPPKGEFFCKEREDWLPEIPGIFHKQEIYE